MKNTRRSNKTSKKVLLIIAGVFVLIIATAVGAFMGKGKESTVIEIEQTVEYGDEIGDKTFTVNTEDGEKEVNFSDLDPEVDTMTVGQTVHRLEIEDETFDVTVIVEDTQKPVINGVQETIELKGNNVNVENELKKLITAEDPVDGELEVVFEINKDEENENNYNVKVEATDENNNKTTEKFVVVVKPEVDKKEEEKKENSSSSSNKDSSTSNKSNSGSSSKSSKSNSGSSNSGENSSNSGKSNSSKPKQEKQPTPEVEFNMPALKTPSGIPSGASLSQKVTDGYHIYSYSRSLPGGGSIKTVNVSSDFGGSATITGTDNDGNEFISRYGVSHGKIEHQMSKPKFTQDDISVLFEVGRAFTRAYGLN